MSFDANQARAMLAHLSPDMAREEWLRVAFALKAELPDAEAFEVFDAWSRDGQGYREGDTRSTWRSIRAGGGVKGGTLVAMAQAAGWKRADKPRRPTPAERQAEAVKRREAAEREARETEARHRAAAQEAAKLWALGQEGRQAPYCDRKGIGGHGTRTLADGSLLVPLRDAAGELWNVQRIAPRPSAEGDPPEKLFIKGARKSGLWHLIGTPPAPGA
jgi:putative DNA primase/helicase